MQFWQENFDISSALTNYTQKQYIIEYIYTFKVVIDIWLKVNEFY